MSADAYLWACALRVLADRGEIAPLFVAQRIGALAIADDMAGVDMWKAIAARIDQLSFSQQIVTH